MIIRHTLSVCLLLTVDAVANAETREIATLPTDQVATYSRDIAPLLKKNCVACHNASNAEGDVNLESVDTMKKSDVDDLLVPGKPESSRLFLVAAHSDEPVMPPEDNDVSASALNPQELALLKRWIKLGANVDAMKPDASQREWLPLPTSLHTVYGSAMTPDGRLSAISFGNQIRVFTSKSPSPIGSLEIIDGDQTKPAHDDFVQDLFLDSTGRRIISAGFRNVKFWEMSPFEPISIPAISQQDVLKVALNVSGNYIAALSPGDSSAGGEISVAEVGQDSWKWKKQLELPDEFRSDQPPRVQLSVNQSGDAVAVGWGKTVRVIRAADEEAESVECSDELVSLRWWNLDRLVTSDTTGRVTVFARQENAWVKQGEIVFGKPVMILCMAQDNSETLVAVDEAGTVAKWDASKSEFAQAGKLPTACASAFVTAAGDFLWVATQTGTLGEYDLASKKFTEISKMDPVAEDQYGQRRWSTLVGERLVTASEAEFKQAGANVTAEKKSLETFTKNIETKTKLRDESQKGTAAAKTAAEAAAGKLADAKATETASNKKRTVLDASLKRVSASIAELEQQLAKLKTEKADSEKQIAAIPDAKKLAEAVKTADAAATKSSKEAATKSTAFSIAVAALKLAVETKSRGETRLKGLVADVTQQQQRLDQVKADQEENKAKELESKSSRDKSRVVDGGLAVLANGTRLVTRSQATGAWSLWSGEGQWIAELPIFSGQAESGNVDLIDSGNDCVLIKTADGRYQTLRVPKQLWQQTNHIGTATGESPFSERVLSVDVDPVHGLLAVGGGQPSRSGELMIFNASDGTLVRNIDQPHADTVLCVRFSPDGKTLASSGADRMIKLWDVETGKLIKTLEGHTHHVTAIAWNVNGRELASGSADASVKIWNVESGKASRTIGGLKTEVTDLVYVGRDNRIGIVSGDSYFRVYQTTNGARDTNAKIESSYLYSLGGSRDGSVFIVGGADGKARLIERSGKLVQKYK